MAQADKVKKYDWRDRLESSVLSPHLDDVIEAAKPILRMEKPTLQNVIFEMFAATRDVAIAWKRSQPEQAATTQKKVTSLEKLIDDHLNPPAKRADVQTGVGFTAVSAASSLRADMYEEQGLKHDGTVPLRAREQG